MRIPWFGGRRLGRCEHCHHLAVLSRVPPGCPGPLWMCDFDSAFFNRIDRGDSAGAHALLMERYGRDIYPQGAGGYGGDRVLAAWDMAAGGGYGDRVPAAWETEDQA